MTVLRNSAGDPARHQQAIDALARETHAEPDRVRELYEIEHAKLIAEARVKTFVSVIAVRLVRIALHEEHARLSASEA